MEEVLSFLDELEDDRQQWKIAHSLKDIVVIVLFGTLADCDQWVEIAEWAKYHQGPAALGPKVRSFGMVEGKWGMFWPEISGQLRNYVSAGKEVPMIKALLEVVSVRGQIVTIDAIGTGH